MQLHTIDLLVITAYMVGVTAFGWYFGRKQKDIRDYFLSDREVPWWALAGSIVATETSTVTFISVPAFAFAINARGEGGNFTFLQLVTGYKVGDLVAEWVGQAQFDPQSGRQTTGQFESSVRFELIRAK